MKKTTSCTLALGLLLTAAACSQTTGTPADQGSARDLSAATDQAHGQDLASAPPDLLMARATTIADVRMNLITSPVIVTGVVTAIHSNEEWYIEDTAGGAYSGISVFCNSGSSSNACPKSVAPPALHDLVTVTGTPNTFDGKLELLPVSQALLTSNVAFPAPVPVTAADLAPLGNSPLRGVRVQLSLPLTVDSVTPAKLYDTKCTKGGDAGMTLCSGCKPPTYSGFQVNDGAGHEVLIEEYFYYSENLASSPECLTQPGAVPVTVGQVFTSVTGIVDVDTFGGVQMVSPVTDSDYTIKP